LVYNGDSGLGAILLDVVKKALGREDCALCAIAYGPTGKRRAWAACEARLGVAVEELHRDQLPAAWGIGRAQLPCILGRAADEPPLVLLTRAEIEACRGSIAELEGRLRNALVSGRAQAQQS
jgi:hypothetical protein